MGACKENYTNGCLARPRQEMTTKGENSRISEDEAIPTPELESKGSLVGAPVEFTVRWCST